MTRRDLLTGAALSAVAIGSGGWARVRGGTAAAPATPKVPLRIEQLGRTRIDDYAWLKPANWKEVWRDARLLDPAIQVHLENENHYSAAMLAPTEQLQRLLRTEMKARMPTTLDAPPELDGPYAYVTRFAPGAEHPRYLRRPRDGTTETLLLDAGERAKGLPYLMVKNPSHSPDHQLFAWAEDATGAEKYRIRIKDLATGETLAGGPEDAFGDFAFSADSKWLFWTWRDASSRPARLYRRRARGGPDILVYEETDPGFAMQVRPSASGRYLFLRSRNDVTSEVRIIDGLAPEALPILAAPRVPGVDYAIEHWRDQFIIRTNDGGAEDFKLMRAPVGHPHRDSWRPWVAHRRGRYITEIHPFADAVAWVERVEGNLHVMTAGDDGVPREPFTFGEAAYQVAAQPADYADNTLRLILESPRRPPQWLSYNLITGRQIALTPAPRRDSRYVLKRLHARADDGATVPVTVLHRADTRLDGSAPLLLTGYGSYGYSYGTGYSAPLLSLIDRGWVWAVAHVRGGSEKGRHWFEEARQLRKKTSFTDFTACAEMLIDSRHTRRGRIVLHGYSAGGLLVGAAANMRPDLWAAVIGQAPFVDMLNTMSDATHPLVPLTRPVWGDPLANPADYDNIASYSPYENVHSAAYPAVLATTAVADDRVGFWEPAKWIAKLRDLSTSGKPMLLHTEMSGGHQGAAGRFDELAQLARIYAFAITHAAR